MKQITFIAAFIMLFSFMSVGQTVLIPGDLAIYGVNGDNPDDFAFILLRDIEANTEIRFTDSGVMADGTFRGGEGGKKYTAPSSIVAGTVISLLGNSANFVDDNDGIIGNTGLNLSGSGDQIFAFQGLSDSPNFIFGIQYNSTEWQSEATVSTNSTLPASLTNGVNAVAVGSGSGSGDEFDNAMYDLSITVGTAADILAAITNINNWSGNNSTRYDFSAIFTITSGTTPTITWNELTFNEAAANDGSIDNAISLTLANETFTTSLGQLIEGTDYTVANVPPGLTLGILATSATELSVGLVNNATNHANADDIANLTISFLNAAFTQDDASAVTNSSKNDLVVDFIDGTPTATMDWDATSFNEAVANDGSITDVIVLNLTGETFAVFGGATNLVEGTHFAVNNVPAGLTVLIDASTNTLASVSLSGNADSHINDDDIANLSIAFLDPAFAGGSANTVATSTKTDLVIDFIDEYSTDLIITEIMYNPAETGTDSTEFIEIYNNDANNINLNAYYLEGVNYTFGNITLNSGEYIVIAKNANAIQVVYGVNVLEWTSGSLSNSGETVSLFNPAAELIDEVAYDDIAAWPNADESGHSLVLCDVTSDNNIASNWTISTNYIGENADGNRMWASPMADDIVCSLTPSIAWNATTFNEAVADDGSISTVVNLDLTDEEFTIVGNFVEGTHYTEANVPAGLTLVIETTSSTTATISLTGNATNNAVNDDINNLEITFLNDAFVSDYAENVENYSKTDLVIDYIGVVAPILTWTGSTFTEAIANDGSIDNTTPISVNLAEETFTSIGVLTENTEYTVANVPSGLTAVITTITNDSATVTLIDFATNHENVNDIYNLTITFLNAAFTGNNASAVENYENNALEVDFNNAPIPPVLTWNSVIFTEAIANNGSFTTDITANLNNETFVLSGTNLIENTHYTVANIPAGLSLTVNANTSTTISVSLVSNATSHESADNITNLTIIFLDAAFTNSTASEVTNSNNNTIEVNFLNPFITPDFVITEIMYNPAETGTDSTEFIEIYNNDVNNINLNAYYLEGIDYTFGNITLNSGEYIVVAVNANAMQTVYGVTALECTSGGLLNSGETVSIFNPAAELIDEVAYDNIAAWPNADGSGHSLVLCNVTSDNNIASNWTISTNYIGENADGNRMWASPINSDIVCSQTPNIAWSATVFEENTANNGSIVTVVDLTLTDDEFVSIGSLVEGTHFTVNNVPTNLVVEITSISTTVATISLTGNATSHTNANDISNMEITFTDTAFVSGFAENVTNYSKTDLSVEFDELVSLNSLNNNSISIYPNPTTGIFTVESKGLTAIEIADVTGKIISTSTNKIFDLSRENNGIYFVKIYTNNMVRIQKLVLAK